MFGYCIGRVETHVFVVTTGNADTPEVLALFKKVSNQGDKVRELKSAKSSKVQLHYGCFSVFFCNRVLLCRKVLTLLLRNC